MSLRRVSIVVLSVVALAIAGCGGGGGSDTSESPGVREGIDALTKAELIEQGDAICAKVNAAITAIESESPSPSATARIAGLYSGMAESLKGLGNPQETEGAYGEYLRARGELKMTEDALKLAAERGSSKLEGAEEGAEYELDDFQEQAGVYGFKECSRSPSAST